MLKPESAHISLRDRLAMVFQIDRAKDSLPVKIVLGVILVVLVSQMFPHPESIEYNYTFGAIWADKDLIAPFSFPVLKETQQYERERDEAARAVYPVFDRHENVGRSDVEWLSVIVKNLRDASAARVRWIRTGSARDSVAFEAVASHVPFSLSEAEWRQFSRWFPAKAAVFEPTLAKALGEVLRTGVLDQPKAGRQRSFVAVRKGVTEDIVPCEKVYDTAEAVSAFVAQCESLTEEKGMASIVARVARAALRPNLAANLEETNREIQSAEENVPRTVGYVQENERIIGRHDRITEDNKLKLDSFQKARIERGAGLTDWKHSVGNAFHVLLVVGLYGIYLFLFRKRIFHDNAKLTLVAMLLLMETFFAYVTTSVNLPDPVDYLIFVPAASMLLTIIFDSRVAFYGTVTMALLIGGIKGNDYGIALTSLVAGSLGAYTVRDIRNRTQIFRSLMFIFIGYSLSIVALSFERNENLNTILSSLTYAMANAIFSPVLTYGLLIFFERVFKITTDLTLLELSDFNQPLLRELAEKAPGTFHHSMILGSLSEAAAESIGANSILARVGAYYHDVGKIVKPEYFVENQVGSANRHNRLKPRMSARIIASHVKEGVDLGRQYGLPEQILDFIPQHHGTTLISYFYDKALTQAERKNAKEGVVEEDYRYPGPKPESRETGIVMLADSVEASTRALTDITPQSLEDGIESMIKQRFVEGQLDYCDLTLRDLTRIKEAFLKILLGIHHQRIQYPEPQREEPAPAEPRPAEKGGSEKVPAEKIPSEKVPADIPAEKFPAEKILEEKVPAEKMPSEPVPAPHPAGQQGSQSSPGHLEPSGKDGGVTHPSEPVPGAVIPDQPA